MTAGGGRPGGWLRWAGAILVVLLVLHAGRVALVRSVSETRPEAALSVWPGHPDLLFAAALTGIGAAAGQGRAPDAALLDLVRRGARQAPLAPEPLWVAAAARLEAGDLATTERLLRTAVELDPRAPAARFLLADLHIRQGRLGPALEELAALERRVGGISAGFAPALVRYLAGPGMVEEVAPALARNPPLRHAVLTSLAADPRATALLLRLSGPGDERAGWFGPAVERLLAGGDLASATALHRKAVGGPDPGRALTPWRPGAPASPFGWRFPPSRGGVAEPVAGGPLRLIHYGREETILAEHLLMLPPGRHRLVQRFAGPVRAGAFEWRLVCLAGNRPLGVLPAAMEAAFTVPVGCGAQKLLLVGRAGDIAATNEAELTGLSLQPGGGEG